MDARPLGGVYIQAWMLDANGRVAAINPESVPAMRFADAHLCPAILSMLIVPGCQDSAPAISDGSTDAGVASTVAVTTGVPKTAPTSTGVTSGDEGSGSTSEVMGATSELVLANIPNSAYGIAVDETHVYFTDYSPPGSSRFHSPVVRRPWWRRSETRGCSLSTPRTFFGQIRMRR